MEFADLYGTDKSGKTKIWQASIEKKNDLSIVTIQYGQIDGKKQIATREYTSGKNIGKKNETTHYEQAFLETERKWKDKKEKEGYAEENVLKTTLIYPMLAATYEPESKKKKRSDIIYPCFVQPKLDGLRCIMYLKDKVVAQSRSGSFFESVDHITSTLSSFFHSHPNIALDGELYTKDIPFEVLAGIIKKKKITQEDRKTLSLVKYHIYDMIHLDNPLLPFNERYNFISTIQLNPHIELVETVKVKSIDDFKCYFSYYIGQEYEGIMLRNIDGIYKQGFRSNDLQKYKEFKEDEYTIIGYDQGSGRDQGTVIWICKNEDGREFHVRPKGSIDFRKELYKNGKQYIGKKLTVIYQELSELNIPRFPVGKAIRDNY